MWWCFSWLSWLSAFLSGLPRITVATDGILPGTFANAPNRPDLEGGGMVPVTDKAGLLSLLVGRRELNPRLRGPYARLLGRLKRAHELIGSVDALDLFGLEVAR